MKAKWVLVSMVVACVLIVAQAGFGQERERPVRQGRTVAAGAAGMFEGLDLTQEQQAKLAEIRESMTEKIRNADSAEARRDVFMKMREEMQGVLTEEQRAKTRERLARTADGERPAGDTGRPSPEARARSMDPLQLFDAIAPRLELTEEQQAKIARLREAAIKKLMQDITGVLTDAQKERLTQARQRLSAAATRSRREAAAEGTAPTPARREVRREGAEGERPARTRTERQREQ